MANKAPGADDVRDDGDGEGHRRLYRAAAGKSQVPGIRYLWVDR